MQDRPFAGQIEASERIAKVRIESAARVIDNGTGRAIWNSPLIESPGREAGERFARPEVGEPSGDPVCGDDVSCP